MTFDYRIFWNYYFDELEYCKELKYADTDLVFTDIDFIEMIIPLGACYSAMGAIQVVSDDDFISSPVIKKDDPKSWKPSNGQSYADFNRDPITLYNQEQVGSFEAQEILFNAIGVLPCN